MNIDIDTKIAAEQAKRAAEQVQRAVEATQRAAEQGQRAAEQAARKMENLRQFDFQYKIDGAETELKALRDAREALESQLKNIEHQIHRLEQDGKSPSADKYREDGQAYKATPAPSSASQN